jgi:hypothetical protein
MKYRVMTRAASVWSEGQMELVTEAGMKDHVAKLVGGSAEVRMAVAFWGDGSLDNLNLIAKPTRIICNLSRGATNPYEIEKIQKAGIEVAQHDDLHAKVYLFDRAALIGSSNASANGLAYQGEECRGLIEANVLVRDKAFVRAARSWFDDLWKTARRISDDDLSRARDEWSKRRRRIPLQRTPSGSDLFKALADEPDKFARRRLYLVVYSCRMDEEGDKLLKRERRRLGVSRDLFAFQEWEALPDNADLVCFYFGSRGRLEFEGLWRMPEDRLERRTKNTNIQLCWKVDHLDGFDVLAAEDWRHPQEQLKHSKHWNKDDGAACIDLGEFGHRFVARRLAG